jgi:hypothetical protein
MQETAPTHRQDKEMMTWNPIQIIRLQSRCKNCEHDLGRNPEVHKLVNYSGLLHLLRISNIIAPNRIEFYLDDEFYKKCSQEFCNEVISLMHDFKDKIIFNISTGDIKNLHQEFSNFGASIISLSGPEGMGSFECFNGSVRVLQR